MIFNKYWIVTLLLTTIRSPIHVLLVSLYGNNNLNFHKRTYFSQISLMFHNYYCYTELVFTSFCIQLIHGYRSNTLRIIFKKLHMESIAITHPKIVKKLYKYCVQKSPNGVLKHMVKHEKETVNFLPSIPVKHQLAKTAILLSDYTCIYFPLCFFV